MISVDAFFDELVKISAPRYMKMVKSLDPSDVSRLENLVERRGKKRFARVPKELKEVKDLLGLGQKDRLKLIARAEPLPPGYGQRMVSD